MASGQEFIEYLCDQISRAGEIRFRKMFGDYAIYCDDKVVALVCDNRVFVKPTEGGRKFIGRIVESPPFPGAKPWFLIEDQLEDRKWLSELMRITADELPAAKPKKKKVRSKK